jgi:spore germination protein KA
MPGLMESIKKIFTYKPAANQTFELLEGKYEGVERENTPEAFNKKGGKKSEGQNKSQSSQEDQPFAVNGWSNRSKDETETSKQEQNDKVSSDLKYNLDKINKEFASSYNADMITRKFKIAKKIDTFIANIDGMVDRTFITDFIIHPLMKIENFDEYFKGNHLTPIVDYISDNVISVNELDKVEGYETILLRILNGDTALFVDGCDACLMINTRGYEKRSVDKPIIENVVLGSQEGFTEHLRTNITLIRKIIKNKNLISEMINIGQTNHAFCAVMYMNGIVNQEVVKEVKKRINSIDADFIIGNGMLGQYIEDNSFMLFPQMLSTERPDRAASFLMEGKVIIISEGTPFAEAVPITFYHLMQTSEDSMLRWQYGTFLRIIRVFGVLISTLLPALYVGLTLFHQEMIPTELLASIVRTKENVPFPTLVEILLLELSFELIREGGIRVPGVIGQTLGIIGALILGQAAVTAGLVSPILIIIVAVTGLGSFAIPNYPLGIGLRIIRFFFTFLAAIIGFYGITIGLFVVACLTCNMKSFGVPFLSPVTPKSKANPDLIIRQPIWKQETRPDFSNVPNKRRQTVNSRGWKNKNNGENNK